MACMVNTLTLVKDKDFGIKLESATPAVDQPDGRVGREGKGSGQVDIVGSRDHRVRVDRRQ